MSTADEVPGAPPLDAVLQTFDEEGFARLGPTVTPEGLARLRQRSDDLMMGRVAYPGMFFQMDAATGRYEDAPLGLGWQGPSLDYRKLEKLELDDCFRAFLMGDVFRRIAQARLGSEVVLYRAILFNKGPLGGSDIPWHQDGGKLWGLSAEPELQIWTALDDAPLGGGCLEVLPGTHREGLATPLGGVVPPDQVLGRGAEALALALPAKAGESILVHNHLWHRSGRGTVGGRRRGFSVCYMRADTRCLRKRRAPRSFFPVFHASSDAG